MPWYTTLPPSYYNLKPPKIYCCRVKTTVRWISTLEIVSICIMVSCGLVNIFNDRQFMSYVFIVATINGFLAVNFPFMATAFNARSYFLPYLGWKPFELMLHCTVVLYDSISNFLDDKSLLEIRIQSKTDWIILGDTIFFGIYLLVEVFSYAAILIAFRIMKNPHFVVDSGDSWPRKNFIVARHDFPTLSNANTGGRGLSRYYNERF